MKTIRQRKVAGARFEHESRFLSRWRNSKQCITEINFFVTKFAELILLQFRGTVLVTIFFFTWRHSKATVLRNGPCGTLLALKRSGWGVGGSEGNGNRRRYWNQLSEERKSLGRRGLGMLHRRQGGGTPTRSENSFTGWRYGQHHARPPFPSQSSLVRYLFLQLDLNYRLSACRGERSNHCAIQGGRLQNTKGDNDVWGFRS